MAHMDNFISNLRRITFIGIAAASLAACASPKPFDYTTLTKDTPGVISCTILEEGFTCNDS